MKQSNKDEKRSKRKIKSSRSGRLEENPPIVIKSGGGLMDRGVLVQIDAAVITVPKEFVMIDQKPGNWGDGSVTLWRTSFTPEWSPQDFQVNIQGDLVTFPTTQDSVVMVTLNNGWVKFKAVPPNDENHTTSFWIEASDYLFGVTTPSLTDPSAWMVSQFNPHTIIIGAEVYPQDSISRYSCTNGNVEMSFREPTLWPKPTKPRRR